MEANGRPLTFAVRSDYRGVDPVAGGSRHQSYGNHATQPRHSMLSARAL